MNRHLRHAGGSVIERCGDRQRKCDGLQKWPFYFFVESLPVMLQVSPSSHLRSLSIYEIHQHNCGACPHRFYYTWHFVLPRHCRRRRVLIRVSISNACMQSAPHLLGGGQVPLGSPTPCCHHLAHSRRDYSALRLLDHDPPLQTVRKDLTRGFPCGSPPLADRIEYQSSSPAASSTYTPARSTPV